MLNRLFKSEHQRVEDMLSAYTDGELSPKEQALVEKHLAQCADCAHNLRTLRQTVTLLGQLPPVAVPRSFAIRPAQVAQRASIFQTSQTYVYLRAATALAAILFAVVLAGDAFLIGPDPSLLAPAMGGEAPAAEVVREMEVEQVVDTVVVEKEMAVEKKVLVTVEVEKEIVVEAPAKAPILESEPAYAATPSPAPAEDRGEWVATPAPQPTPGAMAEEMEAAGTPLAAEKEGPAETPVRFGEERVEATPIPQPADTVVAAEPAFTPTAIPTTVVQVPPSTPLPQKSTSPVAVRLSRSGMVTLRAIEVGLVGLAFVLAVATLVAKRRQNISRK